MSAGRSPTGSGRRGVDVLTAQEDGSATLDDPPLLDRVTQLERVIFSQDEDLPREAARLRCLGFSGQSNSLFWKEREGRSDGPNEGEC
jgi:hypothetical protein